MEEWQTAMSIFPMMWERRYGLERKHMQFRLGDYEANILRLLSRGALHKDGLLIDPHDRDAGHILLAQLVKRGVIQIADGRYSITPVGRKILAAWLEYEKTGCNEPRN